METIFYVTQWNVDVLQFAMLRVQMNHIEQSVLKFRIAVMCIYLCYIFAIRKQFFFCCFFCHRYTQAYEPFPIYGYFLFLLIIIVYSFVVFFFLRHSAHALSRTWIFFVPEMRLTPCTIFLVVGDFFSHTNTVLRKLSSAG